MFLSLTIEVELECFLNLSNFFVNLILKSMKLTSHEQSNQKTTQNEIVQVSQINKIGFPA